MKTLATSESGQALVELAMCFVTLCIFVFGVVDYGRAAYEAEVIKNLAGEGSSMASRGATPATTVQNVISYAGSDLNLAGNGCVIVTVVTNNGGTLEITGQSSACAITATSKIGCLKGQGGCGSSSPSLPTAASTALQAEVNGSSLYVTEIYYNYNTITPIAALLQGGIMPAQLYSVAYY